MPPQVRLVPWCSPSEFIHLSENISHCVHLVQKTPSEWSLQETSQYHSTLLQLEVWRHRVQEDKLPRAVRCTQELLCGLIGKAPGSHLAVSRFVALITHEAQQRTDFDYALPMHTLASRLGLPKDLVDLRHDISHGGALPSQKRVVDAAKRSLQFLWKSFWQPNADVYEDRSRLSEEVKGKLFTIFCECLQLSEGYGGHRKRTSDKKVKHDKVVKTLLDSVKSISRPETLAWREVCHQLWEPGLLLSVSSNDPDSLTKRLRKCTPLLQLLQHLDGAIPALIETCFLSLSWDMGALDSQEISEHSYQQQLCQWAKAWLHAIDDGNKEKSILNYMNLGNVSENISWCEIIGHLINCSPLVIRDLLPRVLIVAKTGMSDFIQLEIVNFAASETSTICTQVAKNNSLWKVDPGQAHYACGWGILPPLFSND